LTNRRQSRNKAAKAGLRSLAQQRNLSDSAFLQRLVEPALVQNAGITVAQLAAPVEPVARGARPYVRLRPEDHVLLRERAAGRGMADATVQTAWLAVPATAYHVINKPQMSAPGR
jgi:hypothetical protein